MTITYANSNLNEKRLIIIILTIYVLLKCVLDGIFIIIYIKISLHIIHMRCVDVSGNATEEVALHIELWWVLTTISIKNELVTELMEIDEFHMNVIIKFSLLLIDRRIDLICRLYNLMNINDKKKLCYYM